MAGGLRVGVWGDCCVVNGRWKERGAIKEEKWECSLRWGVLVDDDGCDFGRYGMEDTPGFDTSVAGIIPRYPLEFRKESFIYDADNFEALYSCNFHG